MKRVFLTTPAKQALPPLWCRITNKAQRRRLRLPGGVISINRVKPFIGHIRGLFV